MKPPLTAAILGLISLMLWPFDVLPQRQSRAGKLRPAPLCVALRNGDIERVKALLADGADVNEVSGTSLPALHLAALSNRLEIAELLLQAGANVNLRSGYAETPLCLAVEVGHSEMVQLLMKHGADVNQTAYKGATALHHAAEKSNSELVAFLLNNGAQPTARTTGGRQPIHTAVQNSKALETNAVTRLLADALPQPLPVPGNPGLTGKALGIVGRHMAAKRDAAEAQVYFVEAKGLLEEGLKIAQKARSSASRKEFWSRTLEPTEPFPGAGKPGIITELGIEMISTLLFRSTPDEYASARQQAGREIEDYRTALEQCAELLRPYGSSPTSVAK
jgi:ankyrin repeat protein